VKKLSLLPLFFVLLTVFQLGCNPGLSRFSAQQNVLTAVPKTFEDPQGDLIPGTEVPDNDDEVTNPPVIEVPPEVTEPEPPSENPPTEPLLLSKILSNAQRVITLEGRRLGTACNVFVHRVLTVSGFNPSVYLANDFDIYAKKFFKSYKAEDFNRDTTGGEKERLRRYIWDYPEHTPFIMQWSRSGVHGHIAIVERIGDKLVIYQSSLGTKTPRKDQTTPEILLNGYNRRQLTVYTEMTPK
jgi:hypothetical protein